MAVTADSVVVRLEADTAGYLRDITRADAEFSRHIDHMSKKAIELGTALPVRNQGSGFFQPIIQDAPRAAESLGRVAFQVGNIGAQFQDIGVSLAGGQSPLLIALQQGTQLSAVLSTTANPIRALGAAFASIVSPVSLVTIATIALGGAAIQYFSTLLTDGRSSTEVIKEQNDLIRRVAENWGEAVPALKAYVDQLDRAAQASETNQAFDILVGQEFEAAKTQLEDIRVGFTDARISLQQFGAEASVIDNLQSEFDALRAKVADNTATTEDLQRLQSLLASTVGAESIPALVQLSGVLDTLSGLLARAANNTATLRAEQAALRDANAQIKDFAANQDFVADQERINGLTTEQLTLEREIARVKAEAERADTVLSEKQALEIAQGRLTAEERRAAIIKANNASTKEAGGAATDTERERQAVVDLIAALEFEQSLLGLSNAEKAVQNALRRAGATATDEQRAAIEELITSTYAEQDALRATEQAMQAFENIATNALTSFVSDLREGKSAAEALSNVFDNLADQLIQIALQGLVQAAFGGLGGGGGIGSFLGGLFGGKRANGGSVQSGKAYLVGERGPEPFIPTSSGRVLPNSALQGGSGGQVVVQVQSSEYFDARVERVSGNVATQVTASGLSSYDRQLSGRMTDKDLRER